MKTWMKVTRSALGVTVVTVTVSEGGVMTGKYAQKCAQSEVKATAKLCHKAAMVGLRELQAAMAEIEEEGDD